MIPNTLKTVDKFKVIVAASGSVAAIKLLELVMSLVDWADIKIIMTSNAKKFINAEEMELIKVKSGLEIISDEHEWVTWTKKGDPVLHIELRKWADAMVIAPLSANTLAKISNGLCDNLITLICRCWSISYRKDQSFEGQIVNNSKANSQMQKKLVNPIVVCPAMNTMMWDHPITAQQLKKLQAWGYTIVDPISKVLACGDQGKGAMATIEQIVDSLKKNLKLRSEYLELRKKKCEYNHYD